jgi:hypothetical protein
LDALAFANATIEAESLFWTIAAWILANLGDVQPGHLGLLLALFGELCAEYGTRKFIKWFQLGITASSAVNGRSADTSRTADQRP